MSGLPSIIRAIARDYGGLPELLAPRSSGLGAPGPTMVHPPLPINGDVSDLIRRIERAAAWWEYELTVALWLPAPYWTRPKPIAVPRSLEWTAATIENPPEVRVDGYWQPGVVPDRIVTWITEQATSIRAEVRDRTGQTPARVDVKDCPECGRKTLVTRGVEGRCVWNGCGYQAVA